MDVGITKSERDSTENLIDGGDGGNPHYSWLGLTEQQKFNFFRGESNRMEICVTLCIV